MRERTHILTSTRTSTRLNALNEQKTAARIRQSLFAFPPSHVACDSNSYCNDCAVSFAMQCRRTFR